MYDPGAYWRDRFEQQGPSYVGSTERQAEQTAAFERALGEALQVHVAWGAGSGFETYRCVLDYGCGTGRFSEVLLAHACGKANYVGVDINEPAVAYAQRRFQGDHRMRFFGGGADTLGQFADDVVNGSDPGAFDVGVAVTVLQHVPERDVAAVCYDLGRCCRQVVLVEDANPEGSRPARHMAYRTPEAYATMLGMVLGACWVVDAERPRSHWVGVFGQ